MASCRDDTRAAGPDRVGPVALAYVGDAVYTLHVRAHLVCRGPAKQRELHRLASAEVRASAQARSLLELEDKLTAEEKSIVRWARNAKIGKGGGGTPAERHHATAFEALLGHLYLTGQSQRLEELLAAVAEHTASAGGNEFASDPAPLHP